MTTTPNPAAGLPPLPGGDARRNFTPLRIPTHPKAKWTGAPMEVALVGGRGEPTRTQADMREALTNLLLEYVGLFPDPGGEVDADLARHTATLITIDHYAAPGLILIRRDHLLKYLEVVRANRA